MMELHPAIVHFPIALLTVATFFGVISLFKRKEFFRELIFWTLLLGVIGAIAAVLTGLIEERTLVHNEAIHELLEKHELNGIAILILSFVLLTWLWVRKHRQGKKEYGLWVLFLVLSTGMVFYQGYLGGRMVFEQGAGVKPMEIHLKDSVDTHSHTNPSHDHEKGTDSVPSIKTKPRHAHSNEAHDDHQVKQDTAKKEDRVPVKEKKELKDMKY